MARPTLFIQGSNAGALPTTQNSNRWTAESELGTILTGDGNTTGLFLGALTNAQFSDNFDLILSHNAQEPVTNVMFYFQQTTAVRTGGTGFTHSADAAGAAQDFAELLKWGNDSVIGIPDSSAHDGIYLSYKNEPEVQALQQLKTGHMDSLENARMLNEDAKPGGTAVLPNAINAFNGYAGGDYVWLKLRLFVPSYIESAGKRMYSFVTRLTYSF